jgi:hypothetical protein
LATSPGPEFRGPTDRQTSQPRCSAATGAASTPSHPADSTGMPQFWDKERIVMVMKNGLNVLRNKYILVFLTGILNISIIPFFHTRLFWKVVVFPSSGDSKDRIPTLFRLLAELVSLSGMCCLK